MTAGQPGFNTLRMLDWIGRNHCPAMAAASAPPAQAGKPPALVPAPSPAVVPAGKPPALEAPGTASPAVPPTRPPAVAVQVPALEDALIRFLGWFGDEPRVDHTEPSLRLAAIQRRPGYVRHSFPHPVAGEAAYRVSVEVWVTGCSAEFRSVRRIGGRTVQEEQRVTSGPHRASRSGRAGAVASRRADRDQPGR
ncbi:hypothetical protein [Muricoccus radiodurans]|uniref:hypothetical protein n=1 Tax=Muricoccus radiodurans TaxID=2231721 RepID=UPI003CF218E9